jgi:hypothetical protein
MSPEPSAAIPTHCAHAASVNALVQTPGNATPESSPGATNWFFADIDGRGYTAQEFRQFYSFPAATTNYRVVAQTNLLDYDLITTNAADNPLVIAGLTCADDYLSNKCVGVVINDSVWFYRWDVTNGFRYVE